MSLKLDAVPVPASFRKRHERQGGAELEMYSVARLDGFLRLTVGAEPGAPRFDPLAAMWSSSWPTQTIHVLLSSYEARKIPSITKILFPRVMLVFCMST